MPLFQQSVLKKFISNVDNAQLQTAWQLFQQHFFNPVIQQNIKDSKEEEYQEGFVRDLFVKVLGYTLNPQPDYNFVLEKKTVTDATKSDGAIVSNKDVIGVVELKDTGTPDLDKVSNQAFGYKHKHKNCTYVITSNFEKLRFYINDATDFEEFELFTLTKERFALLFLCLQHQNILANIPLQIKQQSLVQEKNVTEKLYEDYSLFKRKLFQNITAQNKQYDKLLLFKKTQKLLDRFLFIFFAEDKSLLPPNSVREILKQWEHLKELDSYVPLYDRFKKYFGYLNVGHVGKQHEIFAYNGGLFVPDEILDNIIIDDTVLFDGTKTLSGYDFETDVDVNILGHIFEHSLTEIEELQLELEGKALEKNKTKRKKEGVFYTPRYITKYIVENTVGALCIQKKEELQINEETFAPRKRTSIVTRQTLLKKIEGYRDWLLQLTICDPACGSGAFLNAALEYLKVEHRTADELTARMLNVPIVFGDIDNIILENNLFGVDINEDAIEIAKLSLWLHTAKKGRKLSNLSNNIKCGNSLIDDLEVAGDKAFNWKEEFKNVFDKGGFDVVIGNPPYLNVSLISLNHKEYFKFNYFTFFKRYDIFGLFIEKALSITHDKSQISFIIPSIILNNLSYKKIREYILNNKILQTVYYTGNDVFEDANVDTTIIVLSKSGCEEIGLVDAQIPNELKINRVPNDYFASYNNNISVISDDESDKVFSKIYNEKHKYLENDFNVFQGIVTGNNETYIFDKDDPNKNNIEKELLYKLLYGRDIEKWLINYQGREIVYVNSNTDLSKYPLAENWFLKFKNILEKRRECINGAIPWFSLQWSRDLTALQATPKILIQRTRNERLRPRIVATMDTSLFLGMEGLNFIVGSKDYKDAYWLLPILNSTLINYLFQTKFLNLAIKADFLKKIPIPEFTKEKSDFVKKAEIMLEKNKELNQLSEQITKLLETKFDAININNKLQHWYLLTTNDFFKELTKQKIKLPLTEQQEWLQYFEQQKTNASNIQQTIQQTDKEIDAMVYELYGLSEEEIKVVEGN